MVIYTYNIIYGFPAKNSKPPRGGYTQDTQFSKSRRTLENKTPPTPTPLNPPNHGISRQTYGRQDPPLRTPFNPSQSRHITAFPLNPFQSKYPEGLGDVKKFVNKLAQDSKDLKNKKVKPGRFTYRTGL